MSDAGLEQTPSSPGPDPTQVGALSDGPLLSTFGPYELQELIGRGGMGEVYRAYDTSRGRVVALKRLPTTLAADPTFQARFRAEAALAAKLHDPHVIPIHDFGEIDGQLYIDMRLVQGPDLAHLLAESGPLPAQRVVDIVTQVAMALDAAHAAGLVHRDIKPGNVLLVSSAGDVPHDFVYVADFGIARAVDGGSSGSLTSTGATIGSMDYVAPERFDTGHGDLRADIYALGCVLYEALTAQRPFPVEGLPAIINAHLNTPPPAPSARRPGLPAGLDAVVARAMAKDPDDRYPSAGALASDARRALDGATAAALKPPPSQPAPPEPAPSQPAPSQPAPPAPRPQRQRNLAILATIATVLVLAAAGVTTQLIKPAALSAGEVFLESTGNPGRDPFSGTVVIGNPPETRSQTPVGATGSGVPTIAGDVPALYGGSRNEHVCDRQKLITFLGQNPEKAAAWAGALSIGVADIPTYISGLTPMQLRADTRVTNHGFVDGHATTLQSVLQAGTAVLVDDQGRPRVKCGCGNPLLDPVATPITPSYTGDPWPDFDPRNVSAVSRATAAIDLFIVYDIRTRETFYRPHGTEGDQDQLTTPATTTTPAATTTSPPVPTTWAAVTTTRPAAIPHQAPAVVPCRQGTHLQGTVCVANAPPQCPDGQALEDGRCVPTQVSCPAGQVRDRDQCVPAQVSCPGDAHASADSTCVNGGSQVNCPSGTHRQGAGNTCVKNCPGGSSQAPDGTCVPVNQTCPDGSTKTTGETCPAVVDRQPPGGEAQQTTHTVDEPPDQSSSAG